MTGDTAFPPLVVVADGEGRTILVGETSSRPDGDVLFMTMETGPHGPCLRFRDRHDRPWGEADAGAVVAVQGEGRVFRAVVREGRLDREGAVRVMWHLRLLGDRGYSV